VTGNPARLQDLAAALLDRYGTAADIRALVAKAGGDPTEVDLEGKPKTALYVALAYVYDNPERLLLLGFGLRTDQNWTAPVAALLHELLVAATRDGTVRWPYDIPVEEVARQLTAAYPTVAQCLDVGLRSGLPEGELRDKVAWYGEDPLPTWCNLLVLATLTQRLPALLGAIRADPGQAASPAVRGVLLRLVPGSEQATTPSPGGLRPAGVAQHSAPARGALATPRPQNPASSPSGTERDPRGSARLAVQRSAVEALESLRALMDEALARFGREDAREALLPALAAWGPTDFVDEVNRIADEIEGETLIGAAEPTTLATLLHTLVATVLAGVEAAEAAEDHGIVADLAGQAARAYESVAASIGGEQGEILGRVVPYWRMKAAHARHQDKVLEQRRRLASLPVTAQNPGPTPAFPSIGG
jgi:hypothetical protein